MSCGCGCPSVYTTSCPEIVPVTVNQTVVNIEDAPAMHRNEVFEYADAADHKTFALAYYPYEPKSVQVARNAGVQIYGVDFVIQGQWLVLTVPLADANDKLFVSYLHVDGTIPSQASAVGSIVAAAGVTLDGFLRMDGSTSYLWSEHTTLRDWFWEDETFPVETPSSTGDVRRDALLVSFDGTSFVLRLLQDVSYDGATLVTLNKFISEGAGA